MIEFTIEGVDFWEALRVVAENPEVIIKPVKKSEFLKAAYSWHDGMLHEYCGFRGNLIKSGIGIADNGLSEFLKTKWVVTCSKYYSFTEAIGAFKNGRAVKREGWGSWYQGKESMNIDREDINAQDWLIKED